MELPGRPVPTTFECVEAIALREPRRTALVDGSGSRDYHAVYGELVRAIRVLNELGVGRGDRVAVGMSGLHAGVLLLVAAEALGAVTLSFVHEGDPDAQQVFVLADWVFSDFPQSVPPGTRSVTVDAAFAARLAAADATAPATLPRIALRPEEPQRISRTSGSTGQSKFMVLTRHAQEHWVAGVARAGRLTPDSRVVLVGPLVLNGQFARASASLRMGAAVLQLAPSELQAHDPTHLCALPLMLEKVLESLPPGFRPRRAIRVFTVGGAVSHDLRLRATRAFGGPVTSRYGANEVGSVCEDVDEGGTGVLGPGVDVRIVDDQGRDLPLGETGLVCIRTPALVEGYLDNPQATQSAFRNGWFHSSDRGTLVSPRVLRLAGRVDDLVNIGGIKVTAASVEAKVRELVQPRECAVLALNLDAGATTLGIALVMPGAAQDAVRRTIGEGLDVGAAIGARVVFLPQLPRMPNGKLDRLALHRLLEAPPPGGT